MFQSSSSHQVSCFVLFISDSTSRNILNSFTHEWNLTLIEANKLYNAMIFYSHTKNNLQIKNLKRPPQEKVNLNYNNVSNLPFPIQTC